MLREPEPKSTPVPAGGSREKPDRPIYVGGLDRSGKTTMAAFLSSHPGISIPNVGSNMWTYFYRQYGDLRSDRNLDVCLDAMARYKHVVFLRPDIPRIREEFCVGDRTYAALFALFLQHFAESEGKPRWGAQTGLIERYAPRLFEAYPDLRIIHMVRDPRDRYEASLALWPDGRGRAGGASARWNYSNNLALRHERDYPDRYLVVRFEDLVSDTEVTVREVCSFVGEAFDPVMLEMSGAPKLRDRLADQADNRLLRSDFIGLHRDAVDVNERLFIESATRRGMKKRGYQSEPLELSNFAWVQYAVTTWPNQVARSLAWRGTEELQQRFPSRFPRKPGKRMIVEPAS